jgi:glucokinase
MMQNTTFPRLLGDIGGTNARFAWQAHADAPLSELRSYACANFPSLEAVMRQYFLDSGHLSARHVGIGIATAIVGDWVQMTNHAWGFSIAQIKRDFALSQFVVVNDFTALALGVSSVPSSDLMQLGGGPAVEAAPVAVLGPGTGLGCGGFLVTKHGLVALAGEGGHVTLAANNALQERILHSLRAQFDHISAERLLSGPGLVLLYRTLCALDTVSPTCATPEEVLEAALAKSDPRADAAVDAFLSFLGNVAGNLALTLGALGGVYLGGGILPRMKARLATSDLREQFEKKGRCRPFLEKIPLFVICSAVSPALQGVSRALD